MTLEVTSRSDPSDRISVALNSSVSRMPENCAGPDTGDFRDRWATISIPNAATRRTRSSMSQAGEDCNADDRRANALYVEFHVLASTQTRQVANPR